MNNVIRLIFLCATILILNACKENFTKTQIIENTKPSFSTTYKAPSFDADNRKDKIMNLVAELKEIMEAHAKERKIPGIAYGVVVDNELVIASATGLSNIELETNATTSTAFRIASMTKSFTAIAILKLRDAGKLSLSDPVDKYISEMSTIEYLTEDSPIIDIENLLTMTAGFPEDNPWGDRQLDEPDQMLMNLIDDGVSFSNVPSYTYEYSNTGYAMLGNIVSRVSGEPYQDYITENILLPLGMVETYWEYDSIADEQLAIGYRWEDERYKLEPMLHDGSYGAMGGLITTINDFSKYVSFHLSAWPPRNDADNGPIIRSSLREMQTPLFSRLYPDATDYNGDTCPLMNGYGYGLGIAKFCNELKRISHGGALPGFGSNYFMYPEYGVAIMAFGNLTYTGPVPTSKIEKLLFDKSALEKRKLPISDILSERTAQVHRFIQSWDSDLEQTIIAENLYLDESREDRIKHSQEIFKKAGKLVEIGEITPLNQLRGFYEIQAANGVITVYFTLTPEKNPLVQDLYIDFESK